MLPNSFYSWDESIHGVSFYDKHDDEIKERVHELINGDAWDDYTITLYRQGEMSYDEVYEFAYKEACRQIQQELADRMFNDELEWAYGN